MKKKLEQIENDVLEALNVIKDQVLDNASEKRASSLSHLTDLKNKYIGRKGIIADLFVEMKSLASEEKKEIGKNLNILKIKVTEEIETALKSLNDLEKKDKLDKEFIDVTLPGRKILPAKLHPVTQVMDEIEEIFTTLGFQIEEGPELEQDYYNFEGLNIPKDHPARDMQDTFYINDELCLRTHTSPVQIRIMEKVKPPVRVIAPGTVYRRDSDITHTPMFHQVEGFYVDEGVSFSDLKGILSLFLKRLFGDSIKIRFRPSFFPFTEPSAEVDMSCVMCKGKGCRVCKQTGWLEILGCGMIHPEIFKSVGYDSEKYSGYAFGIGVERVAMLKYGINDLRLFFENDVSFLRQF